MVQHEAICHPTTFKGNSYQLNNAKKTRSASRDGERSGCLRRIASLEASVDFLKQEIENKSNEIEAKEVLLDEIRIQRKNVCKKCQNLKVS